MKDHAAITCSFVVFCFPRWLFHQEYFPSFTREFSFRRLIQPCHGSPACRWLWRECVFDLERSGAGSKGQVPKPGWGAHTWLQGHVQGEEHTQHPRDHRRSAAVCLGWCCSPQPLHARSFNGKLGRRKTLPGSTSSVS